MAFDRKHKAYIKHRTGSRHPPGTPAQYDALVEVMVIATCIDGVLAPGESNTLATLILTTPGFEHLDNAGLARTIEAAAVRVASEGLDARIRALATALADNTALREEAFTLASLFVHFDNEVGDEEQAFLDSLQAAFNISDERASHIDSLMTELMEPHN